MFVVMILTLLGFDLLVFHRTAHAISTKEAAWYSIGWIALSLLFNAYIFFARGSTAGLEFFTGYLIEKALSVDNIFVFIVIFGYFGVPAKLQQRVLFWGVIGALFMRGLFIFLGAELISRFEWVMYVFGVILIWSGIRLFRSGEVEVRPEHNIVLRLARKLLPRVATGYDRASFFYKDAATGLLWITPLFLVLLTIETTDIVFAVDSIPAVFGITRDPFIVFSSNIFAILGLRALYFLLSNAMARIEYLGKGLAVVLTFIGTKMLCDSIYHVPIVVSLLVVAGILGIAVVASLIVKRKKEHGRTGGQKAATEKMP